MAIFDKLQQKASGRFELLKAPGDQILAVADTRQGMVPRFEKAEAFTLTVIRDGSKVQRQIMNMDGAPAEKAADILRDLKVDAVIAQSYMPRTYAQLKKLRIKMYTFDGGPNAAFKEYVKGNVKEL